MLQKQQNRLSRMKAVYQTNKNYESLWLQKKPFAGAQVQLLAAITQLDKIAALQTATTTGITAGKEALADEAIELVLQIAGNAKVYALDFKKMDLYAKVDFSKHYLANLSDNMQSAALMGILVAVQPFIPAMADYELTQANVDSAIAKVRQSMDALPAPRLAIDERAAGTRTIPEWLAAGEQAMHKMDNMMRNFKEASPGFVQHYKQARILVDSGVRHEQQDPPAANAS